MDGVGGEESRSPWAVGEKQHWYQALLERPPWLKRAGAEVWTGVGQEERQQDLSPYLLPS